MPLSPFDDDQYREKLEIVAKAHGFDTSQTSGIVLLSHFCGIDRTHLTAFFTGARTDYNVIVGLCRAFSVSVGELLDTPRRGFSLLSVYPFVGGEPVFVSLPRVFGERFTPEQLFYLRVISATNYETGAPMGTWFLGTRSLKLEVGKAYVLSHMELGEQIRVCTSLSLNKATFSLKRDDPAKPPFRATFSHDEPHILYVETPQQHEEWIVAGRIIGTFVPE